ncbi:MAG: hypothetical protein D6712_04240 [Chloroflexi bacterium]|nr:MAG: hypothetical protein D6712_04240 [Chloroflexota bacterium]
MPTITVHNTLDLLEPLFTADIHPRDLLARAQETILNPDGLQPHILKPLSDEAETNGAAIMRLAAQDGASVLASQQGWGLFNPTRHRDASRWQFARFRQLDILTRLQDWLQQAQASLPPAAQTNIHVYLLPADPANRPLMIDAAGISIFAHKDTIALQLLPSDGNLQRLPYALARALVHNARKAHHPLHTLADWLALEGLAALYIGHIFPDCPTPYWAAPHMPPPDHEQTLDHIAAFSGLDSYSALPVNVYGNVQPVGDHRPPPPHIPDAEMLDYLLAVALENRAETQPHRLAALLYGDERLANLGYDGVGMTAFGGFCAAQTLVEQALNATARPLSEALFLPSDELLGG